MKLGPVTKLDKRNTTMARKFGNDVMLANCDSMACNGVLTPPPPSKSNSPPKLVTFPNPKIFNPLDLKLFTPPNSDWKWLLLHFFTHGYFQQAHAHISEAIITD